MEFSPIYKDFEKQAALLEYSASGVSNLHTMRQNPLFGAFVKAGVDLIPLILVHLKTSECRPVWLFLLSEITGLDAQLGRETIDEAATAWQEMSAELDI